MTYSVHDCLTLSLQDIQEVTGYVLIFVSYADYVPLTSLRIIRGRTLFTPARGDKQTVGYSLYVGSNHKPQSSTIGLKELHLVSLHGASCHSSTL
jgi:Receptor L domain